MFEYNPLTNPKFQNPQRPTKAESDLLVFQKKLEQIDPLSRPPREKSSVAVAYDLYTKIMIRFSLRVDSG